MRRIPRRPGSSSFADFLAEENKDGYWFVPESEDASTSEAAK